MWKPDGWEAGARIGVLTPHADIGPECELPAMAPDDVTVHAARVPFGAMAAGGAMDATIPLEPVRAFADPPHLDDAAELLAGAPVQAIAFAFTSSAYVIGAQAEADMISRLQARTRAIPVVATCSAAAAALRTLGIERMALLDPPWFDRELDALGAAYFAEQGFDVVYHSPCDLPADQHRIDPSALFEYALDQVPEHADAVFIGGNGMRAVGVIEALERKLGRPVLTANQVLLWAALAAAGTRSSVEGYGCLFATAPQPGSSMAADAKPPQAGSGRSAWS